MTILDEIVEMKRAEVERLRGEATRLRTAAEAAPPARPFMASLRREGEVALIAEVKRRSPSAGWIRPGARVEEVAEAYAAAGAAALSVLTDEKYFGGSLSDLEAVRSVVSLPLLRKDFVIDPLQIWEARATGADAILLIVRILDDSAIGEFLSLASDLGMAALVEVHTADELDRALGAGAELIGINSRDLATFRTDLGVAISLAGKVPPDRTLVAESGIRTPEDVDRLGAAGVSAILVGESLMRSPDVGAAAKLMTGRPRRVPGVVD